MKRTLNTLEMVEALINDEYAAWSRAGAFALVEHLEELEEECEMEIEFCPVAIRCDYNEYESLREWIGEYYASDLFTVLKDAGIDLDGEEDDDEIDDLIRSHIQDHGACIEFAGGIIVSAF